MLGKHLKMEWKYTHAHTHIDKRDVSFPFSYRQNINIRLKRKIVDRLLGI